MEKKDKAYGYELIMDLHGCDVSKFNRTSIDGYFEKVCDAIDMKRSDRFWWDDMDVPEEQKQTLAHTKGTSAVQFILTSSIVVHTLELLEAVYVNVFACKEFDEKVAAAITKEWFGAKACKELFIERT
jgi:S-adenosylmethionine/arginine decarboxylase-like enzyme